MKVKVYTKSGYEYVEMEQPTAEESAKAQTLSAEASAEMEREQARCRIADLEAQLSESDYKVVKYAEAQITGDTLPYSAEEMSALHAEREALRKEINNLQAQYQL